MSFTVKRAEFIAVIGDLKYRILANKSSYGHVGLYLVKPILQPDGKWEMDCKSLGGWVFGEVIQYKKWRVWTGGINYYVYEPGKSRTRFGVNEGDCIMWEDKEAILDRLEELGLIDRTNERI